MKKALIPTIVVVVAVLAGVVSYRLSTDALALIVGVLLGLLVMVPVLAVLIWVLRGQVRGATEGAYRSSTTPLPPVIVVQSPPPSYPFSPQAYSLPPAPAEARGPQPPLGPPARTWSLHVFGDAADVIE